MGEIRFGGFRATELRYGLISLYYACPRDQSPWMPHSNIYRAGYYTRDTTTRVSLATIRAQNRVDFARFSRRLNLGQKLRDIDLSRTEKPILVERLMYSGDSFSKRGQFSFESVVTS